MKTWSILASLLAGCGGRLGPDVEYDASIMADASEAAVPDSSTIEEDACSAKLPIIRSCCGGKPCNGTCDAKQPSICTCNGIVGGCVEPTVCCYARPSCWGAAACH